MRCDWGSGESIDATKTYASIVLEATMILEIKHPNGRDEWVDIATARMTSATTALFIISDRNQACTLSIMPPYNLGSALAYEAENVTRDGHVLRGDLILNDLGEKKRTRPFKLCIGNPFCMAQMQPPPPSTIL